MDQAFLDRIRRKVESGDRLSMRELDVLREAARSQPGPTLRLAVAHAMINAEENRSALTLLERLVGDFPRDLQSWLGLASALLALDRFVEAERALNAALALSPRDPEALKALALLAMRRGEHSRAREWIADVLRRDP
ncbi:MAG: tetratricopeptide repeat protein, partial [Myxococcaceae bacterium]